MFLKPKRCSDGKLTLILPLFAYMSLLLIRKCFIEVFPISG